MGYCSILEGQVGISKDNYEKVMTETIKYLDRELFLSDCLQEIQYDGSYIYIYSNGKHYCINEIMALFAKYKDSEYIDEVFYQGEETGDIGKYYIDVGRWCFVRAVIPPPPISSSEWVYI